MDGGEKFRGKQKQAHLYKRTGETSRIDKKTFHMIMLSNILMQ